MTNEETIIQMQQSGNLSKEQAEQLIKSLQSPSSEPIRKKRKNYWSFILLVSGLIILMFVFFGSNSTEPVEIQNISETLNQPEEIGQMNENLSKIIVLFLILVIPVFAFIWFHNNLAEEEEQTLKSWAQVESNFQRRSDLIPNLVKAISKYMKHEAETYQNVTEKRGNNWQAAIDELIKAQVDGVELLKETDGNVPEDEKHLKSLQAAQNQIGQQMHKLIATVENYPDLQSSDQMMRLQAQLEGTENRINIARIQFNEAVADFNASTRKFPGNLIASFGGFKRKAYFKAETGSNKAIDLNF